MLTGNEKSRTAGLLTFIDMKPFNDMLAFLVERTEKFLAISVRSILLPSLR